MNHIQNNVGSEIWLKWEGAKWEESKGPNLVIIVFIGSRCGCSSFQTKWLQNSSSTSVPVTTTKRRRSRSTTTTAWPFTTTGSHFRTNVCSDRHSEVSEFDWLCFAVWFSYYNVEWISFSSDLLLHLRVEWVSHFTFPFLFVCLVKLFLFFKKRDGEGNEYDYYMGKFWVKGGRLFFLGEKLTLKALLGALTK